MKKINIGKITIEKVTEIDIMYYEPEWLYENITEDILKRNQKELGDLNIKSDTYNLGISYHSFVIRAPGLNILVDTCNGNHKNRLPKMPSYHNLQATTYLDNLSKIGLSPKDIDIVICTHLHTDHVGWNTYLSDGKWVPTFPNAKYLMSKEDFDFFKKIYEENPESSASSLSFEDSVLPILNANQAVLIDMNHLVTGEIGSGVWIEPAPGHTPGHITIHCKGNGKEVIMTGDIFHHPILINEPSLQTKFDVDRLMCENTRKRLLDRLADTEDILLTAHFCEPTAGKVISCSHGFKFKYLEE